MPDLVTVIARRWKQIAALTLTATLLALLVCLIVPKKYAGVTTAVATNPALSDKARLFNPNIDALYTALGTADDLDKIEGTAKLDTIYLTLAKNFNLIAHYSLDNSDPASLYKAALRLKKNTDVNRTGYGELRLTVWDKNKQMAAGLANAAMELLNNIHQQLQTENNRLVVQRLKEEYALKIQAFQQVAGEANQGRRPPKALSQQPLAGSGNTPQQLAIAGPEEDASLLATQLTDYARLLSEYELALKTAPKPMLVVEHAQPSPWPDKPKIGQTVFLAFVAALLFAVLLVLFVDSRHSAS